MSLTARGYGQPLTMEHCGSVHYITIGDSRLLTAAGLTRSRLYLIGDAASRCGLSRVGYFIPFNGRRPLNGPTPSFTYIMFIIRFIPMYLRLTTFTKTLHQVSFQLYFFLIFFHPCLLTNFTETPTDPQLPATASNVCTIDARLGGVGRVPPQQKYWLSRRFHHMPLYVAILYKHNIQQITEVWILR